MPSAPVSPPPLSKILNYLLILLPVGILGNLLFSFFTTDKGIIPSLLHFSSGYCALAVVLSLLPWSVRSLRLFVWIRFLSNHLSFQDTFKIVLGTDLCGAISPPVLGGSIMKAGLLMQKGVTPGTTISLTTLENLEDAIFFLVAIPFALAMSSLSELPITQRHWNQIFGDLSLEPIIHKLILVGFGVTLLACIWKALRARTLMNLMMSRVPLLREIGRRARHFWHEFQGVCRMIIRRGKSRFVLTMALTAFQWTCRFSILLALLASLDIPVQPVRFFALQWLVFALTTFTPTPGGMLGAEAAFYFIFHSFIPVELMGVITVGWRFLTFYLLVTLSAILFFIFQMPRRASL